MKFHGLLILAAAMLCGCTTKIDLKMESEPDHVLWRGERAGFVIKVGASKAAEESGPHKATGDDRSAYNVSFEVRGLPEGFAQVSVVKQVIGDTFSTTYEPYQAHAGDDRDSVLVFDRITDETSITIAAGDTACLWLAISVPADAKPGTYRGKIVARRTSATLPFSFEVSENVLPAPHDWAFHLDLWQNPFAVARYFDVPLWSDEHFARMAPTMKRLADAGQKVVTTTILERPWGGQTHDAFGSMVVKTRTRDGKWSYDYSVFDKWVEFMFSLGIDAQINCYSMVPWRQSYDYIDAATGELCWVAAAPGTKQYKDYWQPFLNDFAAHLRAKGWLEKTTVAMDEIGEVPMKEAIKVIKDAEPELKISLAGVSHPGVDNMIDDLSITFTEPFPEKLRAERKAAGQISTFYTCCVERCPNTFIVSDPMQATWIGWFAAAGGLDGYLRWAYNSWTEDPDNDARFRYWLAGDCYLVYPECSSIRFERLMEGIQDFEKVRILKAKWASEGAGDKIDTLDKALEAFTLPTLKTEGAQPAIRTARKLL